MTDNEPYDTEAYLRALEVSDPYMEPIARSAVRALRLPAGSRGLDAGCGTGLQATIMAEEVGPSGHVTGLDIVPEFLRYAEDLVKERGLSDRISFREGDVNELPFGDGTFDWGWSSCCVGYGAAIHGLSSLAELVRVVCPGGIVAILVWSSEGLLPGYPVLEAHLKGTGPGIAPFVEGKDPGLHCLNGLRMLRGMGLVDRTAQTFVADAHAPLTDDMRGALVALLDMRWPGAESELSEEDQAEYRRLCLPGSPDYIVDDPDYYAFFACSMFCGRVPE